MSGRRTGILVWVEQRYGKEGVPSASAAYLGELNVRMIPMASRRALPMAEPHFKPASTAARWPACVPLENGSMMLSSAHFVLNT